MIKIELAKSLSEYFHKDQKYGEYDYYRYHILGVVNALQSVSKEVDEDMIIVALLHDILEDTECTFDTIVNIFGYDIAEYVKFLSYEKGISKDLYLEHINIYTVTRVVKYADSLFNYRECVKVGNMKRSEKYRRNLDKLYHKDLIKGDMIC